MVVVNCPGSAAYDIFRRLYAAIGFGPLVFLSRLPLISQLLSWGYTVFARNRLRLTGRCTATSCAARPEAVPLHRPEKDPV